MAEVQDNPKQKLYDALSSAGYYTKSFNDFDKQFSTPESIGKLHSALSSSGYYTKSESDFNNQFFSTGGGLSNGIKKSGESSSQSYEPSFQKAERERKEIPTQVPYKSQDQLYKEQPTNVGQKITLLSPEELKAKQPKEEGSYMNLPSKILQGASDLTVKGLAMVGDMLLPVAKSDAFGEVFPEQFQQQAQDFLSAPKEAANRIDQYTEQYNLPNTIGGNIATGVAKTVPLVAALYTGNAPAALDQLSLQAPSVLNLVNNTVMSPLTKLLAAQKTSEGYLKADKEGKSQSEKIGTIPSSLLDAVKESLTLNGYGGMSQRLTEGQLGEMAKKGLIAGDGKITKALLNTLNFGMIGGASSRVEDILQGKEGDLNKDLTNAGVFMALEIPHLATSLKEGATDKVKEFVGNRAIIEAAKNGLMDKNAIINFAQAPQEAIDHVNSMKETHQELFQNAIEHGIKGVNSKDIDVKNQQLAAQIITQKASDIKYVSDAIKNDYDGFIEKVNQLDIPLEQKAELIDKANQVKANEGTEQPIKQQENEKASSNGQINQEGQQAGQGTQEDASKSPQGEGNIIKEVNNLTPEENDRLEYLFHKAPFKKDLSLDEQKEFDELVNKKQGGQDNAVQEQKTNGEVLLNGQPKLGLPEVDEGNTVNKESTNEGKAKDLTGEITKEEVEKELPESEYQKAEQELIDSKPPTPTEKRKAEIEKELEKARNEFRIALGSTANFTGPINAIAPLVKIAKLHIESGLLTAKEIVSKLREEYKAMGLDDKVIPDHEFKNIYLRAQKEYKEMSNKRNPLKITDKEVSTATPDFAKLANSNDIIKQRLDARLKKTFNDVINRVLRISTEDKIGVLRTLRKADPTGLVEASFRTKLGYTNKAADYTQTAGNEIFGGLSGKEDITVNGRKTSEYKELNLAITLQRVIGIDTFIDGKVKEFNDLSDKIALEISKPKSQIDYGGVKKLTAERQGIKDYLDKNEVLGYNAKEGKYDQVQFKHPEGLSKESAEKYFDDLEKDNPELYKKIKDRVDKYDKAQKQLLQDKLDASLISQNQFDALTSVFYAPRKYSEYAIEEAVDKMSDIPSPNARVSKIGSKIQALKGGSEDLIVSNYQELLNFSALSTYKSIYEQHSVMDVKDLIGKKDSPFIDGEIAKNKDGSDVTDKFGNPAYEKPKEGYDYIDYYEDGIKKKFQAPSGFVQEYYHQHQHSPVLRALGRISLVQVFKGAITGYNPTFGLFQLLQDGPSAILNSRAYGDSIYGSGVFLKNTPASFKSAFTKDALFREAADVGAFSDMISDYGDVLGLKSKSQHMNLLEQAGKKAALFNENIEYTTRINVYKTMRDKLVSQYKSKNKVEPTGKDLRDIKVIAAGEARSVIDFSRGGTYAKDLNQVVPYLNPAIQAVRASVESFSKNPYRFIAKTAEVASMGALVLAYSMGDLLNESDEEKKKRLDSYMSLNSYQRSNYFNIWNPAPHTDKQYDWIKIPVPTILRGVMATTNQFYLAKYKGQEVNKSEVAQAFGQMSPYEMSLMTSNPVMNAYMKYHFNTDPYKNQKVYKGPKVSSYLEGVDNSSVSTIYKKLGNLTHDAGIGEGLSPIRTQEAVKSFIGDPDRNLFLSTGNKLVLAPIYYLAGNQKALDELIGGSTMEFLGKSTGATARMFNKTPDIDPRIFDMIDKKVMQRNEEKLFMNEDIKQLIEQNKEVANQKKAVNDYLTEKIKDKSIDKEQKNHILKTYFNAPELKDAPDWYKVIKYVTNSEDKADFINAYMKEDKRKKEEIIRDLIKRRVISPQVAIKVRKIKEEPEEQEE